MVHHVNTHYSRGGTDVRTTIGDRLAQTVPARLALVRAERGLDEYNLPDPEGYLAYEPTGLDRWPMIGVLVSRTRDWSRVGMDSVGAFMYEAVYEMQMFLWVRTPVLEDGSPSEPEYDEALRLRDDMTAVVRHLFLSDPTFGTPELCLQEDTLTEDYSEATQAKGGRWISGVTWNFDLKYTEANVETRIGTANDMQLSAESHVAIMPQ